MHNSFIYIPFPLADSWPVKQLLLALFLFGIFVPLSAQMPASSIYAFSFKKEPGADYRLGQPIYLTEFNAEGYNNHPAFFNDSTLYLSSQLPGMEQPEIFSLDLKHRTRSQITDTDAGEFSPGLMPDYYHFSTVRMEYLPNDTLIRLWKFPLNGKGNGRPLLQHLGNVGYYHWLSSTEVVVFKLGNPVQLAVADLYSTKVDTIASQPGRCFRTNAKGELYYVSKADPSHWKLMAWDKARRKSRQVLETLPGKEDFVMLPNGDVLMGSDSKLFVFSPGKDKKWRELADLEQLGIRNISRMALSTNGILALVAD